MPISQAEIRMDPWVETKEAVTIVQGEADARSVNIRLVEQVVEMTTKGTLKKDRPIDLTGKTVELRIKKPSGEIIPSQGVITDAANGQVSVPLTYEMGADGKSPIISEVRICQGESVLKAVGPVIQVLPSM